MPRYTVYDPDQASMMDAEPVTAPDHLHAAEMTARRYDAEEGEGYSPCRRIRVTAEDGQSWLVVVHGGQQLVYLAHVPTY